MTADAGAVLREVALGVRSLVVFFPVCIGEETMSTEGLRKCCHCGVWFKPHARNAYHQRFCVKPECQAASKRASQQKWCRKNPGYFHGDAHLKRVQAWRRKHPGYWKPKGTAEDGKPITAPSYAALDPMVVITDSSGKKVAEGTMPFG